MHDLPDHGTGVCPIPKDFEANKCDPNANGIKKQKFGFSLPSTGRKAKLCTWRCRNYAQLRFPLQRH